ncbi:MULTISPECIES: hypothetical protein [unclassified Sphingomonas]|uniref:hypothetical protein n=1 Tax=Sphingomonas TaxID=13687 RepID=UPI00104BEE4B|nr:MULTISPECIES: hypothetical protein [unclassified Sphingomonas]TCP96996.1 hypothetical protein C8J46_10727 [Sphingomonas sp. PP-F2F-A104-K0414]TCQ04050.1 hypothetical protein C8J40_109184 [Sphingomonas sp. PP-CC-3A-396]
MFFLTLALLSAPSTCTEIKQQCRACPTEGSLKGCSTVGIACQPTRRVCEPATPAKAVVRPDRGADKRSH